MIDKLRNSLKVFEKFRSKKISNGFFAVRLDGRNFTRFTEERFEKPFDKEFNRIMVIISKEMMKEFNPIITFTQSDEISLIFDENSQIFSRRIEKILSIIAAFASSKFSQIYSDKKKVVMFDSRIIVFKEKNDIVDYLIWRHKDTFRNCVNSWLYFTLLNKGLSKKEIDGELFKKNSQYKLKLLSEYGVTFKNKPTWQIAGDLLFWKTYKKEGYNPLENKKVLTQRRKIIVKNIKEINKFRALILKKLKNYGDKLKNGKKS